MKERPIRFKAPMVRALLDGSKTQDRQMVKLPKHLAPGDLALTRLQSGYAEGARPVFGLDDEPNAFSVVCPYGQPGDRLMCYHCIHEQKTSGIEANLSSPERRLHGGFGRSDLQPDSLQRVRTQGVGGLVSAEGTCHAQGLPDDFNVAREQEGYEVGTSVDLHSIPRGTTNTDIGSSTPGRGFQQQQAVEPLLGNGSGELAGQASSRTRNGGRETLGVEIHRSRADAHTMGGPERTMQSASRGPCSGCGAVVDTRDRIGGDHLWVRETWAAPHAFDHLPPRLIPLGTRFHYRADEEAGGLLWRPSTHMPRVASRISLEVVAVRVERLQDISRGNAMGEGCPFPNLARGEDPRKWYAELWEQINGPGSWNANPWVWAVEFRRIK